MPSRFSAEISRNRWQTNWVVASRALPTSTDRVPPRFLGRLLSVALVFLIALALIFAFSSNQSVANTEPRNPVESTPTVSSDMDCGRRIEHLVAPIGDQIESITVVSEVNLGGSLFQKIICEDTQKTRYVLQWASSGAGWNLKQISQPSDREIF